MLVWKEHRGMSNSFALSGVTEWREALSGYEFALKKLSAAMLDALMGASGRAVDAIEASHALGQQYAVRVSQALARRSRAATAKPPTVAPVIAVRRVKAFFVSQKVNGRNAP